MTWVKETIHCALFARLDNLSEELSVCFVSCCLSSRNSEQGHYLKMWDIGNWGDEDMYITCMSDCLELVSSAGKTNQGGSSPLWACLAVRRWLLKVVDVSFSVYSRQTKCVNSIWKWIKEGKRKKKNGRRVSFIHQKWSLVYRGMQKIGEGVEKKLISPCCCVLTHSHSNS